MSREIILIGGKFHRQRMRIDDSQHVIRIPLIPEAKAHARLELEEFEPVKYIEYAQVASIFGEYVIPSNVFLESNMNPVEFIKNLVLDYTK
jgi:hypothetical protein